MPDTDKLEEKICQFLLVGYGYGYGYGYGKGSGNVYGEGYGKCYGKGYGSGESDGYGDGDGSGECDGYGDGKGSGKGFGYGEGSGYGSGDGNGDGYGEGISFFNREKVWMVDGIATIIRSVHGGYARGLILNKDLTTTPIFVAKVGNSFAHGKTLREAQRDAQAKDMEQRPLDERIAAFKDSHPKAEDQIDGVDLYNWHHVLTGSCKSGRDAWCRDNGLNPDKDKLTVAEFCKLTQNSYGGDAIRKLAQAYGIRL